MGYPTFPKIGKLMPNILATDASGKKMETPIDIGFTD